VQCPGLAPELRPAAESRFKSALDFALGGAEQVLLALQAYRLAQALAQDLDEDPDDESELGEDEDGDEDEADAESLIALWEKAESDAIAAAVKPLAAEAREQIATARFEIIPH
jgi:hypothetical protein